MKTALLLLENGKELSLRTVFERIRQGATISRTDIIQATGLSKTTVSLIVGELMAAELVEEIGSENTALGRPRVLLRLIDDARLVLGAELTDDECRVVLTNLRAKPLVTITRRVTDMSLPALLKLLEECVEQAIVGVDRHRVLGLGVCVPGIVHTPSGLVTRSVLLEWDQVALGTEL